MIRYKKRALISVWDKTGLISLAKALIGFGFEILSTGGTAKELRKNKIKVTDVSEYTGFPEIFDGRVKTLHPKIAGGLLAQWGSAKHRREAKKNNIEPIQIVVSNLYPFENTPSIETIDIGGPTMIRSSAKNYDSTTVVSDIEDYPKLIEELEKNKGETSLSFRKKLALKVFEKTSSYDSSVARWMGSTMLHVTGSKLQDLRYGENPHQKASLYQFGTEFQNRVQQLQGKDLSYNNILDMDSASELVNEFDDCVCSIIKHNNPCGVAVGKNPLDAYQKARNSDPTSAFGGVIAFNREVDEPTARELTSTFIELVSAPSFSKKALDILAEKKALRVIKLKYKKAVRDQVRHINGGLLIQTPDEVVNESKKFRVVSKRKPSSIESKDLHFAWLVAKHVKSNAIIFAKNGRTIGIGAGQMSRIDSTRVAIEKASIAGFEIKETVSASDGFFPFSDGVEAIAKAGATAIIQPGGSIKDDEVIKTADSLGLAMIFTGVRHFRH